MPAVFQSQAWFETLAEYGFEHPQAVVWLPAGDFRLPTVVQRAGEGLAGLSNYYSALFGAMRVSAGPLEPDAGSDATAFRALVAGLQQHPEGHTLRFQPLDDQGGFLREMRSALARAGYWTDTFFCFGNWYLPVSEGEGFDAYFSARPSALKHAIARGRKRLSAAAPWAIHIHQHAQDGLDEAIAAFTGVYARSWKEPELRADFMPHLIRTAAAQGWLRLGVLRLNGEPVAAQLWLVAGGKANIFKLAYVQGFERYSAGSILTATLMRHVMEQDQVREVDYLSGDDAYKRDWMSHRRERVGLVAFDPRTPRGLLAGLLHFGRRGVKRLAGLGRT